MIRLRSTRRPDEVSTRRVEAFSDGVFAIAATILVLDLTTSDFGTISSSADLWHAIVGNSSVVISFLISFLLICLLWMLHSASFEYVERVDSTALWLNTGRLLAVVLIPFTTTIANQYEDVALGRMALPINFLFALIMSAAQVWYLTSPKRSLTEEGYDERRRRDSRSGAVSALSVGVVVVAASPWLGSIAFAGFLFTPLVDRLARRVLGGVSPAEEQPGARG
ncbi:TMEM175 family protein [Agromyces atrinae]|uniref:DUF1211 domain-containing protein n=1 Tax=Agromyces atrinae TaxID=592376 RepID=A0A4Q2M9E9_9MICO|nr:TMEM175 family protein [Agromyces atrinae]NYD66173.1 putative membrane protein [Agromyces atrinae]RXZ86512.1 DUF1211 domain-containing protein [Agromyces atrinae]